MYRQGKETLILADIMSKLSRLGRHGQVVIDLGAGCGPLAVLMMEHCERRGHLLVQVDSPEMLALLPPASPTTTRIGGRFPDECDGLMADLHGRAHCVLAYGVLSCVFADGNVFEFVDRSLELLAPGGQLLLADLPNFSKRKRFFASEAGIRFHQEFMGDIRIGQMSPLTWWSPALSTTPWFSPSWPGAARRASTRTSSRSATASPSSNRREDIFVTRP